MMMGIGTPSSHRSIPLPMNSAPRLFQVSKMECREAGGHHYGVCRAALPRHAVSGWMTDHVLAKPGRVSFVRFRITHCWATESRLLQVQ